MSYFVCHAIWCQCEYILWVRDSHRSTHLPLRTMRRVAIKERDVLAPFAVLMTVNCALMTAWTLVDPMVWYRTESNIAYQSTGYCRAEGDSYIIFLILIGSVNFCALTLANVQAFQARNIGTEFSESFYVFMTMVSLLQALVIGAPLLVIARDNPIANYLVWSGLIFVMTMAILGLMFVPKMMLVREKDSTSGQPARNSIYGATHVIAPSGIWERRREGPTRLSIDAD